MKTEAGLPVVLYSVMGIKRFSLRWSVLWLNYALTIFYTSAAARATWSIKVRLSLNSDSATVTTTLKLEFAHCNRTSGFVAFLKPVNQLKVNIIYLSDQSQNHIYNYSDYFWGIRLTISNMLWLTGVRPGHDSYLN